MKYSVVMPVRNGGEYIKACINSLLSQTLPAFNILVLDNCSTDGTSEWLTSLNNEKIVIFPSDKPLSIEENWGRIRDIPKNEYITLIGHDDLLYPGFLENIDKLMEKYPSAGLYHTHFQFIDAKGKVIRNCKTMPSFFTEDELLKGFLTQSVDSMGTGYVMRAADYDALGGIPVKYPNLLFADFELWLRLAEKGGMAVASDTLFAFRVHKGTTGTSHDSSLHSALDIYVNFLSTLQMADKQKQAIIHQYSAKFLLNYCKGFSHRLLRTKASKRVGVNSFIDHTKVLAAKLGVEDDYHPLSEPGIRAAKWIDSNNVLRHAFLLFKKLFANPLL